MRTVSKEELAKILVDHKTWRSSGGSSGARAYLAGANLARADLSDAYLADAYLAVATAAKTDDTKPSIALEFEFLFDERAWGWFGRNVGGFATIDIKPAQLSLAKKAS